MRFSKTTLGGTMAMLLLSACTGHQGPVQAETRALFFVGEDGSSFNFTPTCVENMRYWYDAKGRELLEFDMKQTSECHKALNQWVKERIGEQVKLNFGRKTLSTATLQSPLGAKNITIGTHDQALLKLIHDDYSDNSRALHPSP